MEAGDVRDITQGLECEVCVLSSAMSLMERGLVLTYLEEEAGSQREMAAWDSQESWTLGTLTVVPSMNQT